MNMFRAFMELDESYNDRQTFIDELKKAGKNYNFDKYTDAQLYRMVQRLRQPKVAKKEPIHELDLDFDTRELEYCDCGQRLSDAGFCPVCDDGEEDLREWKDSSGKSVNNTSNAQTTNQPTSIPAQQTTVSQTSNGKYRVRIVTHGGRLRALGTDGVHPAAWVAFPNHLRQFDGQLYEVDQLIWNGKNYRAAGNIVEI
jgi:hypothetical protein